MTYKLAIFDFDGTIADTFPWAMRNLAYLSQKYNLPQPSESEIDQFRGLNITKVLKHFQIPPWKLPLLTRDIQKRMNEQIDKINLFLGIPEMFRQLHDEGVIVGIASSNSKQNIEKVIGPEIASVIQFFDCGIGLNGKDKKLTTILKKSGIPLEQSLYIGDEIRDIEATKRINMPFGAVSWGYAKVEALEALEPHEIFYSVQDMTNKICGITA